MPSSTSSLNLATFAILCPTSFFLGMLFSLFPYDYPLLWSSAPLDPAHLTNIETHLKLLHNSPNLIVRMMHIITAMGLLGLVFKLYKPSESNMLFDGGSLVLYMVAIIVYVTNIVRGLRIVSDGSYGLKNLSEMDIDALDDVDAFGNNVDDGNSVLGREDNLKVLAASNVIAALVLVGVIVLQVGQWYAERVEAKERAKAEAEFKAKQETAVAASTSGSGSGAVVGEKADGEPIRRTTSRGEGKKHK